MVSFSFFFANHRQAMYILMVETKVSTFANFYIYIMETLWFKHKWRCIMKVAKLIVRVVLSAGAGFAVGKFVCQPIFEKLNLY